MCQFFSAQGSAICMQFSAKEKTWYDINIGVNRAHNWCAWKLMSLQVKSVRFPNRFSCTYGVNKPLMFCLKPLTATFCWTACSVKAELHHVHSSNDWSPRGFPCWCLLPSTFQMPVFDSLDWPVWEWQLQHMHSQWSWHTGTVLAMYIELQMSQHTKAGRFIFLQKRHCLP